MIKQVPAQEGQFGLDGLLVTAQERLVAPAGHPDELSQGSAVHRADGWQAPTDRLDAHFASAARARVVDAAGVPSVPRFDQGP
jgi:hypothetical protein